MAQKFLVTPALPYANGLIHLGHLLEHVQVNLFVRALRMSGKDVLYVCGADSHGTPIEINAMKAGIAPEIFTNSFREKQEASFKTFGIEFDGGYGSTHSKDNEEHAEKIFAALKERGLVSERDVEQFYDPEKKRFLPDRMVRGTCPHCKAQDQYGDSCEACGRTYQPTDLLDPKSALSGAKPVLKSSRHYFVSLKPLEQALKTWVDKPGTVHDDTRAFLAQWFKEGLKDWDISRDGPYFGFLIPGETDKYFYVWLDAPIGYISLTVTAAKLTGRSWEDYWRAKDTSIVHFIGKDIVYFHTLFWPAMLMAADYTLPSKVVVHGMLTVDGVKMSKSRGTFILADTFAKHVDPEALRYYFACKLSNRVEDIDLSLTDFVARVNTDLVNKVVNLISRSLPMLHRYFDGVATAFDEQAASLVEQARDTINTVEKNYLDNEPNRALFDIIRLAEVGNRYLQETAPWSLVSSDKERAQRVLSTGLYIGSVCFGLLKPVMPRAVKRLEDMVNAGQSFSFSSLKEPFLEGKKLKPYEHLFTRVPEENITAMINETKSAHETATETPIEKPQPHIDIDQFMAVELRAAKVTNACVVEGSDKLISCTLDVGPFGTRHVFSGLRPHVTPEELVGKTVVMVLNLAPRKMRFGMSEGMILAAGEEKPCPLYLSGVSPGDRVR